MADLVGQRRQRQIDPLAFEARALPIERGVHAELVEQDRRQQRRADQAARRGVERRGRLADLLAVATGELLAHRLDQFEAARDLLQRLGHVFADLGQPRSAAAGASLRRLDDDALALDVLRPGLADRPLAREGADLARLGRRGLRGEFILGRGGDEVFEFQFQLLDQSRRALGALPVEFAFELLDPQLKMRDQRLRCPTASPAHWPLRPASRKPATAPGRVRLRPAAALRVRPATPQGRRQDRKEERSGPKSCGNQIRSANIFNQNIYPTRVGRNVSCGFLQSIPERR